ncbi:lipid A deacylase LpxR family protein [Thiomicrorhabdus sp. Kp2]|uniref:lipid A deacylase LpxR family protein n=1 Tax=Thiomicrorhabdus sp. Kp2 TaxID=1123518 RepID=UPI000429B8E4|nr:lipid A deacylase LpxR family protein [Thiomicrorhabdus sp. Kp2]
MQISRSISCVSLSHIVISCVLIIYSSSSFAKGLEPKGIFSFVLENDVFYGKDQDYTNGVKFIWIPDENTHTPEWALNSARLIPWFPQTGRTQHGYAFGQSMFTPSDITIVDPPEGERPYAGWLYAAIGLASENNQQLDQVSLMIGVIGPASLAQETQTLVHDVIGSDKPMGWDTQLSNELGVVLSHKHSWREFLSYDLLHNKIDLSPYIGSTLGNVFTYANAGLTFRYGKNLPNDYGPPRLQPGMPNSADFSLASSHVGWYLFAGFEGRAIARNIFLDGNSFVSSRSVEKFPFVGDIQFGFVVDWKNMRLSYTHLLRTEEYKTQQSNNDFGALTVGIKF